MRDRSAKGVWPPVATPFLADLSVDYERYRKHCSALLRDGAHGLAVLGTTSEATSLDLEERQMVLEHLIKSGIDPQLLLPGTGTSSLGDTAGLTRHAVELGVRGVLLLPPYYYKSVSDDGLFQYVQALIERVANDRLRIYLYHFPQMSGVGWSHSLVGRLVEAFPEIIVGLKNSSGDSSYANALCASYPSLAVFAASEASLLMAMRNGAAGCISATANTHVTAIRRLYDGWQTGHAEHLQNHAAKIRRAVEGYAFVPAVKAILAARDGAPDWLRIRPPLEPLSASQRAALLDTLASIETTEPAFG